MDAIKTLEGLANWLLGGGALIVASVFASWFLEPMAWFQALSSRARSLVILVIALLIGVVATYIVLHPGLFEVWMPYIVMIIAFVSAWISTQKAHSENFATRKRDY